MKKSESHSAEFSALDMLLPADTDPAVRELYERIPQAILTTSFGLESEVVLLDLETTGLMAGTDTITEVALMKMRGPEIIDTWTSLINPGQPIPKVVVDITGITDEMVKNAPRFSEVADTILAFIGSCDLIAHNANFDRGFLKEAFGRTLPNKWLDTVYLTQIGLPRLLRYSQPNLAVWLNPEAGKRAHRAMADVEVLSTVWRAALCGMNALDYRILKVIADLPNMGCGGEHAWIRQVLDSRTDVGDKAFNLTAMRRASVRSDQAEPLNDANELRMNFSADGDIMKLVSQGVPRSKRGEGIEKMYEDFELRPAQNEMANAVYQAFLQSHFLAVEAGTGVGKSLAYLLPAALVALENQVSIGIATKSNALTDQLMTREIPRLNKFMGGKLRYTAVKGYENYLCLRKIDALLRDKAEVRNLAHLIAWISQSPWGDVSRISMASRFDETYIATQQECNNKKCRFYPGLCYLHGTRKRAQSSHLVVTNHSLLFRDAMSPKRILPPIRYWIVDEAHSIEKEARTQLSYRFVFPRTAQLLHGFSNKHNGLARRLDIRLSKAKISDDEKSSAALKLVSLAEKVRNSLSVFEAFKDSAADVLARFSGRNGAQREMWISQEVRTSSQWGALESTGKSLYTKLDEIHSKANALYKELQLLDDIKEDDIAIELNGFVYDIEAIVLSLGVVIGDPEDNLVYSLVKSTRESSPARLEAAPLEVGSIINNEIYSTLKSLVYTSATMTVAGKFSYFMKSVGLDFVEPTRLEEKQLSSSYKLREQMHIYVIADMPDPREERYLNHLTEFSERLHLASGGGVLSLFTNRRDMERVYESVQPNLAHEGLDVLLQREGASSLGLAKIFIENQHVSMMGLKSFWEGFDAKGDTLRCVFIPKLPFALPGTPLAEERSVREGAKAWNRYDLPEAIIDLRQAIGRLIRSSKDTGVVVLGDSRLINKAYGKRILDSLPVEAEILTANEIIQAVERDFQRNA